MRQAVFALIDCNNFFVSCERLFQPQLRGRPVVVLSSNDGCVVARSNEAKVLGIPMGAPAFKYRPLFKQQGVVQFSANFELYGDISQRITRVLTGITPRTEVYSVDESFLDLSELDIKDYEPWGQGVRQRLLRDIGVPVSIGIATTKTLAKLASERAKKGDGAHGILELARKPTAVREGYLRRTPINDVWGIGWRLTPRLKAEGLHTALDIAHLEPRLAGHLMGVHGRQLVAELNGTSCHPLAPLAKVRQSVMHGRMFGEDTDRFMVVEAAIASMVARAAHDLRRESLLARSAVVHLSTNRHKPGYERLSRFIGFATPTADTGQITAALVAAVRPVFNSRVKYHRVNVLLHDLVSQRSLQPDFFGLTDLAGQQAAQDRLTAFDALNQRYGKRTLRFAAEDLSEAWQPQRRYYSQRYTTHWQELPVARLAEPTT